VPEDFASGGFGCGGYAVVERYALPLAKGDTMAVERTARAIA
jgi:hypothetical protein